MECGSFTPPGFTSVQAGSAACSVSPVLLCQHGCGLDEYLYNGTTRISPFDLSSFLHGFVLRVRDPRLCILLNVASVRLIDAWPPQ